MASIRQRNNRWQARIRRLGQPDLVKTFTLKQDAERWARSIEAEMDKGQFTSLAEAERTTLKDLIQRYLREVSPNMKGHSTDSIRLNAMMRKDIAKWSIAKLSPAKIAAFRDERLREVSSGTVIRELAYISSIINHARREWGINITNPVQLVRKPPSPEGRNRNLTNAEIERLMEALTPTGRRSTWTKPIAQLALETAMRRGELLSLRWDVINFEHRTVFLKDTKNGESRTVPLSSEAVRILQSLPRSINGAVFPVKFFTFEAAFKRAVNRAGLVNLHFHDLRHTAITEMAKKLPNIIELSAVSGHKNLAMLKRYYHPDPRQLAHKLG